MSGYSTGGAVPVVNEKGHITMQKVKVTRYQPGKKPDFAKDASSSEESYDDNYEPQEDVKYVPPSHRGRRIETHASRHQTEDDDQSDDNRHSRYKRHESSDSDKEERPRPSYRSQQQSSVDSRLARLENANESFESRLERRRALLEDAETGIEQVPVGSEEERSSADEELGDEDEVEEEDEDEAMQRRARLRELARNRQSEELMAVEEDQDEEVDEEEEEVSEYEEYEDEDDMTARLKPVFVRKSERVTIQERDEMDDADDADEEDTKKLQEERKHIAKRLVEEEIKREIQAEREAKAAAAAAAAGGVPIPAAIASLAAASANKHPGVEGNFNYGAVGLDKHIDADNMTLVAMSLEDVVTDDEGANGDVEYEKWKLRELKRIKRDRDEREAMLREREEIEAVHNMTEEERLAYLKANPKKIINQAAKGKYKFLQKYYHRGAYFLDKEEDVLKRDICEPTLEDHFDRTIMPKVMQVKNFGKKGRTKYTHLVDQDTTGRDAGWNADRDASLRFHQQHGAGMKQVFDKPSTSKRKQ